MKVSNIIFRVKHLIIIGAVLAVNLISAASAKNIELNWVLWSYNSVPYYGDIIAAYEAKYPNVTIKYTDLGSSNYSHLLMMQLTGGAKAIDVMSIRDIPSYAALISKGEIVNLNDFVKSADIDTKAYSGLVDEITVDGNLYAMPYRSDFWLTYYNKAIFDKAGVKYPTNDMTTQQFDALAQKVTSGSGVNKIYGSLFHLWRSTVQLNGILDGKHTLAGGDYDFLIPSYKRVLALQAKKIIPDYQFLKMTRTQYMSLFLNGSVAMLPMGSWSIGFLVTRAELDGSSVPNWGLVKYPHPKGVKAGTTASTITSIAVNVRSKHRAEAENFVKFISGPEGAAIIAESGTIPALHSVRVINTIVSKHGFPKDRQSREAMNTVKTYLEMPVTLKAEQIEKVLNRAHDAIMTKRESIKAGIKEMNDGVSKILAE